jgi:integrase
VNTSGLKGKSIDRLLSLKKLAEVSKEQYLNSLKQFLVFTNQDPDTLVASTRRHPKAFEKQFVAFLDKKGKETSAATVALIRNSVKKLLDVNGVSGVDWAYINDCIPEKKRFGEDRAPTSDEIRRMASASDLRTKCIILFLCSSGARMGSIPALAWRDVHEVEQNEVKLARVTIYRGTPDQYETFITPETYEHLQEYKRYRENVGEKVSSQSFVFVTALNVDNFKSDRVRGLTTDGVKALMGRLQKQLAMRQVISEGKNARRFEFKTVHGFRKFFKTRMEMSGVKPIITEILMGHEIGVSGSYMKPTEKELLEEYSKAIPSLTIFATGATKEDMDTVKKEAALEAMRAVATSFGIDPMKVRVEKQKEIGREVTGEEEMELIKVEIKKLREPKEDPKMIVREEELDAYLKGGWQFVSVLPSQRILIRK